MSLFIILVDEQETLLLSATPVQQRRAEYLDLLRLLLPSKYDSFTEEKFGEFNRQTEPYYTENSTYPR